MNSPPRFGSMPELAAGIRFAPEEDGKGDPQLVAIGRAGMGPVDGDRPDRETEWKTAIWFDTKQDTHLLPVKGDVRKAEGLVAGSIVRTVCWI